MNAPETFPAFMPDLQALLAPIPAPERTGPSLRYEPVYAQIREARRAEDDSLPMGDWVRPLKKADWPGVETLCTEVLRTRSKDLQVAGWLTEAWTHQRGVAGFDAGARLLRGLVQDYWDDVHPRIEDGDSEIRIAPFVWAAQTLPDALAAHVPLLRWPDLSPPYLTLLDWERALRNEFDAPKAAPSGSKKAPSVSEQPAPPSRQDILDAAEGQLGGLARLDAELQKARATWRELDEALSEHLGDDAPSLAPVSKMLESLQQATVRLLQGRDPQVLRQAETGARGAVPEAQDGGTPDTQALGEEAVAPPASPVTPSTMPETVAEIGSREEAYRLLDIAATYLQRTEPHSPTPYLVRRAVAWGRLPLPELMMEIVREEGDLSRYFSMLGIKSG